MSSIDPTFAASPEQARSWKRQDQRHYRALLDLSLAQPLARETLDARLARLIAREEILRTELVPMAGLDAPVQRVLANDAAVLEVRLQGDRLELRAPASHLDGPSLRRVARALLAPPASDEEPSLQHADYAAWKHELLAAEPAPPAVAFWRDRPQPTEAGLLSLERAASDARFEPASLELAIERSSLQQLRQSAAAAGVDARAVCLAGFAAWLARLGDREAVVVGVEGDERGELLDAAIGPYARSLPLLAAIDPSRSIVHHAPALDRAYALARSFAHGYEGSEPAYVFSWLDQTALAPEAEIEREYSVTAPFALRLVCAVDGERLRCRLDYDAARFDRAPVACLAEQWTRILAGVDQPVSELELLGPEQRARIAGAPPPAFERCGVLELILRQVTAAPDAVAIADRSAALRYRSLNARANQLARALRDRGVQAGDVVAIELPPCADVLVAILAIHKLGAAYLPIDPAYPLERRTYMREDSAARLVVREDAFDALARYACEDLELTPRLDSLAYLIYTSGSTGQPKAVEITHESLSRSTQVRLAYYPERVRAYLLLSSFSFDSSVAGIFWTLAQGGTLVVPDPALQLDPSALAELCEQHGVSHGLSLPSVYDALLDVPKFVANPALRRWIVAGEACRPGTIDKHRARVPAVRLTNEYGPTEATVWATAAESSQRDAGIGRPIPGMELWLLNERGVPAAIGEPGEIFLGGPLLARGYRGRPEQTAERFYVHPGLGRRVYRTGDRARYAADGCLCFAGRVDRQIKLRGHRIELGEIERRLAEHPEVGEAAVIARDGVLAAFVEARGGADLGVRLRAYLQERLPGYMQPSSVRVLETLPRTPNGKLDLQALPAAAPEEDGVFAAPANDLEAELAELCAELLKLPRVSRDADFFELGGDSISSLQWCARAAQRGIGLRVRDVFEHKTIARLASVVTRVAPGAEIELAFRSRSALADATALRALSLAAERPDGVAELCAAALAQLLGTNGELRLLLEYADYRTLCQVPVEAEPALQLGAARRALRDARELEASERADCCLHLAGQPAPAQGLAPVWLSLELRPEPTLQLAAADESALAPPLENALASFASALESAESLEPSAFPDARLDSASLASLIARFES